MSKAHWASDENGDLNEVDNDENMNGGEIYHFIPPDGEGKCPFLVHRTHGTICPCQNWLLLTSRSLSRRGRTFLRKLKGVSDPTVGARCKVCHENEPNTV